MKSTIGERRRCLSLKTCLLMSFRQEHGKLNEVELQKQTETTMVFGSISEHTAPSDSGKPKMEKGEYTETVIRFVLFLWMCVQYTCGGCSHRESIAEHLSLLL